MPEKGQTGVAKALDIESISNDIAKLARQLGKEAEGEIDVRVLETMRTKIESIKFPKE